MPNYVRYGDGRYSAPHRTAEVEVLFNFQGYASLVNQADPLIEEQEQTERFLASHWIRPEVAEQSPYRKARHVRPVREGE